MPLTENNLWRADIPYNLGSLYQATYPLIILAELCSVAGRLFILIVFLLSVIKLRVIAPLNMLS